MVFNNIWVILVCLFGQKEFGGKLEVLVECVFDQYWVFVYICVSKVFKFGMWIFVEGGGSVEML